MPAAFATVSIFRLALINKCLYLNVSTVALCILRTDTTVFAFTCKSYIYKVCSIQLTTL